MTEKNHHGPQTFIQKYVFSLDHKVIGLQYMFTALTFLLLGFGMVLLIRWQLAFPGRPVPLIGALLLENFAPGGALLPSSYNQLGAMHGTIMVFLGIVPLGVGFYGNYFLPLQIGAGDMAFPRLNMMSYWTYFLGGVVMLASFLMPGGAAQSGWTSYPPLANIASAGQTAWLIAMTFIITSSLFGSINFVVTTVNMRAPGLGWLRLPIFVWAQFVTALLLLFAFPVLQSASILQLLDRVAGTSFFIPMGLVVGGDLHPAAGGGSALLWQHLFWFLAHPEVYVLLLPAIGIVAEIIANNTRRPIFGYKHMVGALIFLGVFSFLVWAHHMFLAGIKTSIAKFFMTTTMVVSIPSVALLTCLILSLWGGSIRFTIPMRFALAFLPMFGIGGLTGLPLGFLPSDIHLHDTYYVIGHFHYVVVTGSLVALMAGIYHWFPKMFGRKMDDRLGNIHFWGTIVCMNGIFFPMFIQGMAGVQRRLFDFTPQVHNLSTFWLNYVMLASAVLLLFFQFPFIYNLFNSLFRGEKTPENPWEATTLEWACPSPPPHGNFTALPRVHRGPYEYGAAGAKKDWVAQNAEAVR
ncbi:MAG: cytochrome c oxidase subunit I [Elusimicrobiota bacterium]